MLCGYLKIALKRMPEHNWFEGGSWNAACDICGRVFKSGQLIRAWDNSMRCSRCFETRQPQDFVRAVQDKQDTPWSRVWLPQKTQIYTTGADNGVSLTVSLSDAAQLPQPGAGQQFIATLSNGTDYEVVGFRNVNLGTGVVSFSDRDREGTVKHTLPIGTTLIAITEVIAVTYAFISTTIIEPGPTSLGTFASMGVIFSFVNFATHKYHM